MSGLPRIDARDLALLAGHLALAPLAWLVPERHWLRLGRIAGMAVAGGGGNRTSCAARRRPDSATRAAWL